MAAEEPPQSEGSSGSIEKDEDFGYGLFPDRQRGDTKSALYNALFSFNPKCRLMLKIALDTSKCRSPGRRREGKAETGLLGRGWAGVAIPPAHPRRHPHRRLLRALVPASVAGLAF